MGSERPRVPPQARREALALDVARHLEAVAWVAMRAAGAPGASAFALPRRCRARPSPDEIFACFLGRSPEPSAREPHHDRVGVLRLELTKRRKQLLARRRAKRR